MNNSTFLSTIYGNLWRFAPMVDPLVREWHSRDLDSRLSDRETSAVQDWLYKSTKTFHIMRDHIYHVWPIMAGMFGMRNKERVRNIYMGSLTVTHPYLHTAREH